MSLILAMSPSQQMPPEPRSGQRRDESPNAWMGRLLASGSVLVGLVVLGVGTGYWLDARGQGSHHWVLILGIAGVVLGLAHVVRSMRGP